MIVLNCIICNLISFKAASQNNEGDALFTGLTVHTINIVSPLSLTVFFDSLLYYKDQSLLNGGDDTYMKVDITIDNVTTYDIGVHLKGNSSYTTISTGNKKSIKIDFDKYVQGQDYDGLDKLNLNNCMGDPTLMREKLTFDLFNNLGLPSPRSTYANVYLNGTLWGLYAVSEIVEGTFLKGRFGNKDGNLFKGDDAGHLIWEGSNQTLYENDYELCTNEDVNDWSDLIQMLDVLNNTTDSNLEDSLELVLNTQLAIKNWALCNLLVNLDSYLGTGHNYYIYHNTQTDQFEWIPWDVNESLGAFAVGLTGGMKSIYNLPYDYLPSGFGSERPLIERMLQNNTYKKLYTDYLYELISNWVNPNVWNPKIDSIANVIRLHVYADPNLIYSIQDFEDNIDTVVGTKPGLKLFIQERYNYLDSILVQLGYQTGLAESNKQGKDIFVYPNPSSGIFTIKTIRNSLIAAYDILGNKVAEVICSNGQTQLDLSAHKKGIYFFKIQNGEEQTIQKIILQ